MAKQSTDVTTVDETGAIVPANEGNKVARLLDDTETRSIVSYEDAIAAVKALGGTIEKAADFEVEDKDNLIAVPMFFIQWRFNTGNLGEFVSIEAITREGRKVVINDGSTGIRDQLMELTTRRIREGMSPELAHAGLEANGGLRVSRDYVNAAGVTGTTYYVQGLPLANRNK